MLEFNSRNITSGYIKQLLSSIYLPSCKVFKSEKDLKNYFSGASTTSYLPDYNEDLVVIIKNHKGNEDWFVKVKQDLSTEPYMRYWYNHFHPNLTKKLRLENDLYDSYTHRYLGDYLRFIRDCFDVDLMSMYNCFDNTIEVQNNKKYLIVPIKYGKTYSIFSSKNSITYSIDTNYVEGRLNIKDQIKLSKNSSSSCIILDPLYPASERVVKEDNTQALNKFTNVFREKNLRLIIEQEVEDNSPFVVLEGNYATYKPYFSNIQINYEKENNKYLYETDYSDIFTGNVNISNFQLVNELSRNQENYPIADRLLEYLFGNVITDLDPISKNIIDAKKKFAFRYQRDNLGQLVVNLNSINGKFTIMDRFKMLDAISMNQKYDTDKQDLLGFVDKDVEAVLDDERYPLEVE